jgi:hypothetical protein
MQVNTIKFGEYSIAEYKPNKNEFLNAMTCLFGGSKTGKTRTAKTILYGIKKYIQEVFLFSATEIQNQDFRRIVPNAAIYHDLIYEKLEEIYNRQLARVQLYKSTQNVDNLKSIYKKHPDPKFDQHIKRQIKIYEKLKLEVEKMEDMAEKIRRREDLELHCENTMLEIYRVAIRYNIDKFQNSSTLSDSEKLIISLIDVPPPHVVIIIEDFGEILKQFTAKKYPVFAALFTKARHYFITTLINIQDDTFLEKNLRNNAHNIIFTNGLCASGYFNRPGMSVRIKKFVAAHQETFFGDDRKLVYFKDRDNVESAIRFIIPKTYEREYLGSPLFIELCLRAEKKQKKEFDEDNAYIKKAISLIK